MARRKKSEAEANSDPIGSGGHNAASAAAGQLLAYVQRIERLQEEKKTISDDEKEVYAELKGNGFDSKIVRKLIAERKRDRAERLEEEAMLELYRNAIDSLVGDVDEENDVI